MVIGAASSFDTPNDVANFSRGRSSWHDTTQATPTARAQHVPNRSVTHGESGCSSVIMRQFVLADGSAGQTTYCGLFFQAGHAGSIPVTRSIIRIPGHRVSTVYLAVRVM